MAPESEAGVSAVLVSCKVLLSRMDSIDGEKQRFAIIPRQFVSLPFHIYLHCKTFSFVFFFVSAFVSFLCDAWQAGRMYRFCNIFSLKVRRWRVLVLFCPLDTDAPWIS